ncbi:MAG TPA: HAMP domain-containing sensor histidine kinase [Longimicrobiaceae bacterium]|nr:HAMP domain-containing sensor histidine kinase [Longimicrobiaceae bacterium]
MRRHRLRPGRRAPLLLLALSLGIAATAILQAAQASRSQRATAEGLVRDYGAFAVWSFGQHLASGLDDAFRAALEPVARPAGGTTPTVDGLLAAGLAGDTSALHGPIYGAPYYFRVPLDGGAPDFAGEAAGRPTAEWLAGTVLAHARTVYAPGWDYAVVAGAVEGRERVLVFTLAGPPTGERSAYGFELDPERFRPLFDEIVRERSLLPTALMDGRRNADLLAVQLLSPAGRVLFASDPAESDWRLASGNDFHAELGGLRVRATVRPAAAGSLIIGGLPRSRLPWLGGLLLLAVGLSVVAVGQLRREGELARLRSDFVASVSHELRTPLAQVRLFLETLRLGRWSTEQQREWILDNLERETTRLTALVDNVLHFSRAERGATGGDRETVCLADYLEGIVRGFAPLAASRRVSVETRFEPGLFAPLHAESFRQVLLNLLDNAVKYGPQGQTVLVTAEAADGGVRIAVEDRGPGIPPRERERIWEPFRRGEGAVGSVAVGSGIGLAVVRELVEWHEGTARVEEAPGGGARFVLRLPGWRDRGAGCGDEPADARRRAV